jgi:TatD DNase family protein
MPLFLYCKMSPSEQHFINIHSHRKPQLTNEYVLRNAYLGCSADTINNLPYAVSVGLHPWHLHRMSATECYDRLIELAPLDKVWAIGEIGLDKAIEMPVSKQIPYFEAQLDIARAVQKPIIIHAVRTYQELIPYLKKTRIPFIFHQFAGNKQQAAELLKYPCLLSFGQNLNEPKSAEAFLATPNNQIFLETDTSSQYRIDDIYNLAAKLKEMEIDELKSIVFHNFANLKKS